MKVDYIANGRAHGSIAQRLVNNNFNLNAFRPWVEKDGKSYVTVINAEGKAIAVPTSNAALLRKDDWIEMDRVLIRSSRQRLRLVADLNAMGLTYNLTNGMGKSQLEYETMKDFGSATISMDPVRQGERDRPVFELKSMPLPIISGDFSFTARQIAISRSGETPLDLTALEQVTRRVAETAEALHIGTRTFSYGGGTIYGITTFPGRMTQDLVDPADAGGWDPEDTVDNVLEMRQKLIDARHFGPYRLYVGKGWDRYLDRDYKPAGGNNANQTVRTRISAIDNINGIVSLDYLDGLDMLLVQMTPDVIRTVNGIPISTIQWEEKGGMEVNFKVLAMMLPQIREDADEESGIVHGTIAD